jgi:glutathione S-transferase
MTLKLFELVAPTKPPVQSVLLADADGVGAKGLLEKPSRCLTEKDAIAPHQSEKVPVLLDGDIAVVGPWTIANYLKTHPTGRRCSAVRAVAPWLHADWWGDVR